MDGERREAEPRGGGNTKGGGGGEGQIAILQHKQQTKSGLVKIRNSIFYREKAFYAKDLQYINKNSEGERVEEIEQPLANLKAQKEILEEHRRSRYKQKQEEKLDKQVALGTTKM